MQIKLLFLGRNSQEMHKHYAKLDQDEFRCRRVSNSYHSFKQELRTEMSRRSKSLSCAPWKISSRQAERISRTLQIGTCFPRKYLKEPEASYICDGC